jgi:prepilin-type processing-associated H-X9-DG protein
MQCANNLKQLGLALHNHHDTFDEFPMGSTMMNAGTYYRQGAGGNGNNYNYARLTYIFKILPYMEQTQLYNMAMGFCPVPSNLNCSIVANGRWSDSGTDPWSGIGVAVNDYPSAAAQANCPWYQQVPGLLCPSDGKHPITAGSGSAGAVSQPGLGQNSYMMCTGDWPDGHPYATRANVALQDYVTNPRGAFPLRHVMWLGPAVITGYGVGTVWQDSTKSMGGIIDGTSNTIAIAEKCIGDLNSTAAVTGTNIKRAFAVGIGLAALTTTSNEDPTAAGAVPSACFGSSVSNGREYTVNAFGESGGVNWAEGIYGTNMFSTILPPNAPTCSVGGTGGPQGRAYSSASSEHTGGVNVLRFDGSVQFVSDTVSVSGGGVDSTGKTGLDARPVRSGPSPYGVWGAMGSIDGGESVSP